MSLSEQLKQGIAELGLALDESVQQQLLEYLALLQKWNKVYNLTAIRDAQTMVTHHLLDSLVVLPHLWSGRWLDVGCGAGIPGVILAICRPDWQFVMLDSNSKKTSFVQQAIIQLGLRNATVVCARIEQYRPEQLFDGIISRAFTELDGFISSTQHVLAPNGRWAAMKGAPEPELARLSGAWRVQQLIPLQVPGLDAARSLVIVTGSAT